MDYLVVSGVMLIMALFWKIQNRTHDIKIEKSEDVQEKEWFGKESKPKDYDSSPNKYDTIRPFKIDVKDEILKDLQRRLENTRLEEPMDGTNFFSGFNPKYMKEVIEYWKTTYNWREQEKRMNNYSQFTTEIEGIQVHFIHVKPQISGGQANKEVKVVPLMMIHGWPSTCMEFLKVINMLTTENSGEKFVFEVVCPSIPGYGFSERPHKEGLDAKATARIFIKLMNRIGHPTFFVHGGDWGSRIACNMARFHPQNIKGVHITMCSFALTTWDLLKYIFFCIYPFFLPFNEQFMVRPFWKKLRRTIRESGYFYMNATKPDTLGCAMSDSPSGVAAYLLEKYSVATNSSYLHLYDGGLTKNYTLDELLNIVMITWVNNSFTAGIRFYRENVQNILRRKDERSTIKVPSGVSVFPHEVLSYPQKVLNNQMKKLVYYNVLPKGGHFIGLEEPAMLAEEIRSFVSTVQSS